MGYGSLDEIWGPGTSVQANAPMKVERSNAMQRYQMSQSIATRRMHQNSDAMANGGSGPSVKEQIPKVMGDMHQMVKALLVDVRKMRSDVTDLEEEVDALRQDEVNRYRSLQLWMVVIAVVLVMSIALIWHSVYKLHNRVGKLLRTLTNKYNL